jgi:hypothetical protein
MEVVFVRFHDSKWEEEDEVERTEEVSLCWCCAELTIDTIPLLLAIVG